MEKDVKLDKLCHEFGSLDVHDKDHILGIAQALAFSVQQQGLSPGKRNGSLQEQGGKPMETKAVKRNV
jgi:hypothetical protein